MFHSLFLFGKRNLLNVLLLLVSDMWPLSTLLILICHVDSSNAIPSSSPSLYKASLLSRQFLKSQSLNDFNYNYTIDDISIFQMASSQQMRPDQARNECEVLDFYFNFYIILHNILWMPPPPIKMIR
jgi:hypothetical protein